MRGTEQSTHLAQLQHYRLEIRVQAKMSYSEVLETERTIIGENQHVFERTYIQHANATIAENPQPRIDARLTRAIM